MVYATVWRYDARGESHRIVQSAHWQAELELRYERRGLRTVLAARRHCGPLVVQKALYPEGDAVCHGIVLHPPGGIVGGDELRLQVAIGADAAALLTTPGAAKWYRSTGATAHQHMRVDLQAGASLEWLPHPSIAFRGARGHIETEVHLEPSATYIGWEFVCLGRSAAGERFEHGSLSTGMHVTCAGEPLWRERARIEGGTRLLESAAGLGGHTVTGTLVAVSTSIAAADVAPCRAIAPRAGRGAVTRLPGLLVARYLGDHSEAGHDYFARIWHVLRPRLIGRTAITPRIWRT